MSAVLIVVPVFALIAAGYAAVALRFISPTAHKGISEFAFSIAIPALLFRIVVVAEFPAVNAFAVWGAYYGATAATWIVSASGVIRSSAIPGRRRGAGDRLDLRQHRHARASPDLVGPGKSGGRLDGTDPVGQHAAALALRHAADGMGGAEVFRERAAPGPAGRARDRAQSDHACAGLRIPLAPDRIGAASRGGQDARTAGAGGFAHGADRARHQSVRISRSKARRSRWP